MRRVDDAQLHFFGPRETLPSRLPEAGGRSFETAGLVNSGPSQRSASPVLSDRSASPFPTHTSFQMQKYLWMTASLIASVAPRRQIQLDRGPPLHLYEHCEAIELVQIGTPTWSRPLFPKAASRAAISQYRPSSKVTSGITQACASLARQPGRTRQAELYPRHL